jgi:hypothetical protein
MEYNKYNFDKNNYYKKHRFGKKTFFFLSFLLVVGIVLFSTFYSGSITGKTISSLNQTNLLNIQTSFSFPEINLKGEYTEVIFSVDKNTIISLDNKQVSLTEPNNQIILKNFKGNVDLNENYIEKLDGRASEIIINNVPINLKSGKKIYFVLSPNSNYDSLEIKEEVYLKDFSFETTGSINFGSDYLNLNSENVQFKNYIGSFKIQDKKLILQGFVESLKIEGDLRKISLSR